MTMDRESTRQAASRASVRQLRQFAGMWTLFFLGLACWQGLWRANRHASLVLGALAAAVGPVGLVKPEAIRPIFLAAMAVTIPIGWTVSQILVALLFYGIVTPVAVVFRLMGRDVLKRKPQRSLATYWTAKPSAGDVRRYLRQF
jgi:hypothetical protein